MSGRLSHLNRRLVKVERQVVHIARREQLADCKCFPPGPNGISYPGSSSRMRKSSKPI
jgi:hypothetical protein